jgi:signal transduction histidine kinase
MLARAEVGSASDLSRVSLPALVAAAIEARAPQLDELGLQVRKTTANAEVRGSTTLLARMVDNLMDNAIRHNRRGGWITVTTRTHGSMACLVVENGGAVLDEAKVRELGQPFHRLGTDRTASSTGVGLGLSIVSAIATAHHGSLVLHARPEGGLQAAVEVPVAATITVAAQEAPA